MDVPIYECIGCMMKRNYLKYYQNYSLFSSWKFIKDILFAGSKIKRLSLLNRHRDYMSLQSNPALLDLHYKIHEKLLLAASEWQSHDYGEGYFYQGLDQINITGLRNTKARVDAMGLRAVLKDMSVLEIGCNSGFLAISLAETIESLVGFDLNPYLLDVAQIVQRYLQYTNLEFVTASFDEFETNQLFDAVLSFANHTTYDGNSNLLIKSYFEKCKKLIKPNGLLLFESHPPQLEGPGLKKVCQIIDEEFTIVEQRILNDGTFLDRNRTFIMATNNKY